MRLKKLNFKMLHLDIAGLEHRPLWGWRLVDDGHNLDLVVVVENVLELAEVEASSSEARRLLIAVAQSDVL